KLREFRLEGCGLPAPGQALGEHRVGVGVDRQMTGGEDAGKNRCSGPAHNHEQGAAAAIVDEAENQALKGHRKPNWGVIRTARPGSPILPASERSAAIADGKG